MLPLGVSPVSFRFRVGLDWCQCAWLVLPIQVAGPDSVPILGSGSREVRLGGRGGGGSAFQKEKTQTQLPRILAWGHQARSEDLGWRTVQSRGALSSGSVLRGAGLRGDGALKGIGM